MVDWCIGFLPTFSFNLQVIEKVVRVGKKQRKRLERLETRERKQEIIHESLSF